MRVQRYENESTQSCKKVFEKRGYFASSLKMFRFQNANYICHGFQNFCKAYSITGIQQNAIKLHHAPEKLKVEKTKLFNVKKEVKSSPQPPFLNNTPIIRKHFNE